MKSPASCCRAGGGSVFGFARDAGGLPTGAFGVVAVKAGCTDFDLSPDLGSSQVTIGVFGGIMHHALWRRPMARIGNFCLGGAGRSTLDRCAFAANRPQIRTIQCRVEKRIDPAGPAWMENATSILLRLRFQDLADRHSRLRSRDRCDDVQDSTQAGPRPEAAGSCTSSVAAIAELAASDRTLRDYALASCRKKRDTGHQNETAY